MSEKPLIQTHSLVKQFGGVSAVDGIDFEVYPGEIRCLIGPNGAGKSTFFKCLTHQYKPTSGTVIFDGKDLGHLPIFKIARLGLAIKNQIPSVYPKLSAREGIWMSAQLRGLSSLQTKWLVDSTLDDIAFSREMAEAPVDSLSHAHRQWVELGMLMASAPRLALLDEPTAGMTSQEMLRTVELIKLMNKSATIIVVEHDLDFIAKLAQRVTVLHKGQVIADDSMEKIQKNELVRDVYLGRDSGEKNARN